MKCLSFGKNDPETIFGNHHKFDLIELRLDLAQMNVSDLKQFSRDILKKMIVTDKRYINNLPEFIKTAAVLNVFAIDLDFQIYENQLGIIFDLLRDTRVKLILSCHNITYFDKSIVSKLLELNQSGHVHYLKIVFDESVVNETEYLFDILKIINFSNIIAFVSGEKFRWTRYLTYKLFKSIVYLSIDENSKTAKGQLTLNDFEHLQRILGDD